MPHGHVFDIQHYAVHDGPGIRTLVFLKGCPLRCAWCCNPESQAFEPEIRHVQARCVQCLSCARVCPYGAIVEAPSGVSIDRSRCKKCEVAPCVDACPQAAMARLGRSMSADDVIARVAADIPFYRNSGGGVTFSGGEPLAQPVFLKSLLKKAKSLEIHTAVSTCGFAMPDILESVEPLVDLFLFDLKIIDPGQHRIWTGLDNARIQAAFRWLTARCVGKVVVRVPVVIGCTDGLDNAVGIGDLCQSAAIHDVILEPYHALGTSKYQELGMALSIEPHLPSPTDLEDFARVLQQRGIRCEIS